MDRTASYSTVTGKGQMTAPQKVRKTLRVKPGDKLESDTQGTQATIRAHPGIRSLKGVLASNKGKGMSFAEVREVTARGACSR